MRLKFWIRQPSPEELTALEELAGSGTAAAHLVERAQGILAALRGDKPITIAERLGVGLRSVYRWVEHYNIGGLKALQNRPRKRARKGRPPGRQPLTTAEQDSRVLEIALTSPEKLGLPFSSWTLDRLEAHINESGIPMPRDRIKVVMGSLCALEAKRGNRAALATWRSLRKAR